MRYEELIRLIQSFHTTFQFLVNQSCLARQPRCRCGGDMELKERKRQLDLVWWRCVDCRTWRSIRKDSFFEHSHLSLMQWSLILFHWSTKTPSQQIQTLTGLSEKTIIKVLSGIRTICSIKIGQDNIRLGGPGIIIEIDESKFGVRQNTFTVLMIFSIGSFSPFSLLFWKIEPVQQNKNIVEKGWKIQFP